ncbi:MarR family winged helix-turn-helix transcriptional regulator [Winogradskya consettensis]|uniref:Transcriptional regulator n=1 Tax=Winogradskya consettensis TaxID=113560 RepID=A0A919W050_9ACTN|nr:transcriptional regulator [Actinoplanes consettensis]
MFDDLIRFETILWNTLDARLRAECDTTLGSLNILMVIDATPDCRVQEVAGALAITVGGASQSVDRLERAGLCIRTPHPRNRRSSILRLTAAGDKVLARAGAAFDRHLAALLGDPLSATQRDQFGATLKTLRASISD